MAPSLPRSAKTSTTHGLRLRGAIRPVLRRPTGKTSPKLKTSDAGNSGCSPFVGFDRPSASEVKTLHRQLVAVFGERRRAARRKSSILDTVVGTILSQNTTNSNSAAAFQKLKSRFRSWEEVRVAKPTEVEEAIRSGGLAPKKTKYIQSMCSKIHEDQGSTSLEFLRRKGKSEVHAYLEDFDGVGKKTAAIINLFDIGHADMAVDTHVFRYAVQLGWVPSPEDRARHNGTANGKPWPAVTRDSTYAHLDATLPDELKYSLHLLMTDTTGGLPTVCGANKTLTFDGGVVRVDTATLAQAIKKAR